MRHTTKIAGTFKDANTCADRGAQVSARDALRGDIVGAIACAVTLGLLAASLFTAMTASSEYDTAKDISMFAWLFFYVLLLGAACYLAPAAALHLTRLRAAKRFVPGWVLIAVCGSVLLTISVTGYGIIENLWHAESPTGRQSLTALVLLATLSVITLPVTYGAGHLFDSLTLRRNNNGGADQAPLIPRRKKYRPRICL